jgi:hypothetical protein
MDEITVIDNDNVIILADCETLYETELPLSAIVYVRNLKQNLIECYEQVRFNRNYQMNVAKIYYDRNIKPKQYKIGDLVLTDHVKIKTGLKHGMAHKYHGPFVVVQIHSNGVDYIIRKADTKNGKKFMIHHNRLKKYFGRSTNDQPDAIIENKHSLTVTPSRKRPYKKNVECKRWLKTSSNFKQKPATPISSSSSSETETLDSDQVQFKNNQRSNQALSDLESLFDFTLNQTTEPTSSDKNVCKVCNVVNEKLSMIACDQCDQWYHLNCQHVRRLPLETTKWFCKDCKKIGVPKTKPTVKLKN